MAISVCKCLCLPCKIFGSLVKFLWILLNILIIAGGIILLATGGVYISKSTASLIFGEAYTIGIMVLGSAMIVVGFFGFIMGCTENKCIISIYSLVCGLTLVPLIVLGIIVLVWANALSANSYDWLYNKIADGWTNAVSDNSDEICSYMADHNCSGFSTNCVTNPSSNNQCPPSTCAANSFVDVCNSYIIEDAKKIMKALGGVSIAFGAVMLLGVIISWVLCCCPTSLSITTKSSKKKDATAV
mmetsp:Transcript_5861/g.10061  ORF Transcript_5861/g.10061 Transcript_5861/m.10061 type:complete len:243 (+) Transcript_5861:80-808(+)|eukprot:CAMPEP_0196660674 /NCGR_PEP_ID=MMETSP1086-20130531/40826_1 /TAXON_ID=77921 /ORGANISM="Cyanoptyche  gloeocystis , Strain SAG4.97" /LENGTH=242 /DNA_ID=CAMNT_0041995211 /DNA_START=75 /DNA_END=803 /DNA_ORIENTATION=+